MALNRFYFLYVNSDNPVEFHPNPTYTEELIGERKTHVAMSGHLYTHRYSDHSVRYAFPITNVESGFREDMLRAWREDSQVYMIFNYDTTSMESLLCDITNKSQPFHVRASQQEDRYSGVIYLTARANPNTINGRDIGLDIPFRLDSPERGILDNTTYKLN